ncbi:MAG: GNAT family N-acetyltransferase [Cyclobacteriaceae bacterium]
MKNLVDQIHSKNLLIRKLKLSDATEMQQLLERNKTYMLPWIPWAKDEPESIETKKEKIRNWNGKFLLDQTYSYGLFDGQETMVGLVFLFTRQGDGILEIGYIIDHLQAGKGYATESSYVMTKLCFHHIKVDKVVIHCNSENVASGKIPEKLGYKLEASVKNPIDENGNRETMMIWAFFSDEFMVIDKYEPVEFQLEEGW